MDVLTCDDADTGQGDDDASGELPGRGAPGLAQGSREQCTVDTQADINFVFSIIAFFMAPVVFPTCK